MDQAIYKAIVSYIRGKEDNFGSRWQFAPGAWTYAAEPKKK